MTESKITVLCVDDDPTVLEWLDLVLSKEGYAVEVAESAEAGLKRFRSSAPDLVIVDLMMEEIDSGADFVKEIKASGCDVPIYLLSAASDELNQTTSYAEMGFDGVFQKPMKQEQILPVIAQKLRSRGK